MRIDLNELRSMAGLGVSPDDTAAYVPDTVPYDVAPIDTVLTTPDTISLTPTSIVPLTTTPSPTFVTVPTVGPTQVPAAASPSFGTWLESLISGGAKTVETIEVAQNVTKGVYTSTDPKTGITTTYVQPSGTSANIFSASQTGVTGTLGTTATGILSGSGGMILLAGAALLLILMMSRGGGGGGGGRGGGNKP